MGDVEEAEKVRQLLEGRVVSVGYMLRYLKGERWLQLDSSPAVQQIKLVHTGVLSLTVRKCIADNNLTVMLTLARYFLP